MSRRESSDESTNDGSGTDSEEDQKQDEGASSRSTHSESSSGTGSDSETEDTESRFMVLKNNNEAVGDKRQRESDTPDASNKKPKVVTRGPTSVTTSTATKPDSQSKASPATRQGEMKKTPAKKTVLNNVKKPENTPNKKDEPTPKKAPQAWSSDDEYVLIYHILKDMKTGIKPPKRGSRGENYHYWGDLHETCREKFLTDWSKEQLYDKYRRMKSRYDTMVEKERTEGINALKFKNAGEEKVYNLWKQIYEMQEQEEEPPTKPPADKGTRLSADKGTKALVEKGTPKLLEASTSKKVKQNGSVVSDDKNGMAALQELQKKSNAALVDMQSRIDQIMSDFQGRSQGMVQEMVKGAGGKVEGLNEWLSLPLAGGKGFPFGSSDLMTGLGFGGFGLGFGFGGLGLGFMDVKLKEHWLKQQEEELKVIEKRVKLMQEMCHQQLELLKKQQAST